MTEYSFRTPVVEESPTGKHRLFYFYNRYVGVSVKKVGGVYSTFRYPVDEDISTYQEFYQGGRTYTVSAATRSALIAANIGIDSTNFTAI